MLIAPGWPVTRPWQYAYKHMKDKALAPLGPTPPTAIAAVMRAAHMATLHAARRLH